tara:strand:- start:218 stop:739 length:522 start_codon:yes stop_codon:yes gene_type:complete
MSRSNQFLLKFVGLKDGDHKFEYKLDNNFFITHGYLDFNSCNINVKVQLIKKVTVLELNIIGDGITNINCTLSNESFDYIINSKMKVLVKFGEKYDDSNDELIILPHGSHTIELDQLLYEMIVLSMPIRNVHPGIEDGSLKSDILNRLKDFDINKEKSSNFDPRWEKLKQLKK